MPRKYLDVKKETLPIIFKINIPIKPLDKLYTHSFQGYSPHIKKNVLIAIAMSTQLLEEEEIL